MGQQDAQNLQLQQGQHSFRKQLAIEDALKGATSDEDVIRRLMPLDPPSAIKLRAEQWKSRKDQTDATQKATEIGSQMVSSFLALPDSEKPAQYPILVQQWNQLGIHPINLEPWSPALIPGMQRIAAGGLAPKEGVARMDLSGNGDIKTPPAVPPSSPAVNALTTPLQTDVNNGLTNTSQSIPIVKGMQNSVANALAQANQPDDYVGTPLPDSDGGTIGGVLKPIGALGTAPPPSYIAMANKEIAIPPYTEQPAQAAPPISQNPAVAALTSGNGPIDKNRPIIHNSDGSFSTERTITIGADGKYLNIPTIVNGQQLTPEQAIQAWKDGKNKPVGEFNSQQEAEDGARARSAQIGQERGAEAGVTNGAFSALTAPTQTAPVEVTGQNNNPTPDSLRAQAAQLRATRRPANLDLAKELETAANNLDSRQMEQQKIDREKLKPVSNVPGAYFNQVTGEFTMDGKTVSSSKMQEIANAHSKAGATQIGIGDSALGLGKTAQGKVDESLLDTTSRIAGLNRISAMYKPEYQQMGNKLANMWTGIKSSLGANVDPADKQKLSEFYAYKRNAITTVNQYIHDTTGASMGVDEAKRLMQAVPNPGSSWYDGDNPIEFKAKLDDTLQQLKMAEARLVYIKRNGMSTSAENLENQIPLNQMPAIINKRGAELEAQISKNPKVDKNDVQAIVRRQLAQEFGLSSD
jgi:hypothetical protein